MVDEKRKLWDLPTDESDAIALFNLAMTISMPCWFYDKGDLRRSPSVLDGLDIERESRYRREGARFIINVGTKMGLRYDTMATGVVYFHRFYMFHSFKTFPRYLTACCCLFLAGKVEETPKKCKDVIKIAKTFLNDSQFAQFGDDPKEEVMTLERILLQTIKFDLQVDHPYGYLLKYAKCLKGDKTKLQKMVQMAWTFINDSLCTTLCLQWEPEIIAIALMYLAGKLSKFEVVDWIGRTSKHTCWWDMYVEGMSIELLEDICHQVLDLYSTPVSDAPQNSPPATPPTKSTIRKVQVQPQSPAVQSQQPAAATSKPKDVPVGQPIPRLEPGELKRKVSKSSKKDSSETKASRLSSSKAKTSNSSSSPVKHSSGSEGKGSSPSPLRSQPSNTHIYQSDSQYSQNASVSQTTSDAISTVISQPVANVATVANQYMQAYGGAQAFVLPEPGASYFADGSTAVAPTAQYLQSAASFMTAQPPPSLPSQPHPVMGQHPQQQQPIPGQYPEMYGSHSQQAATQMAPQQPQYVAPPPQMHVPSTTGPLPPPVGQYPPLPNQPPANVMMPGMSVPPLPSNANMQHPPPPMPVGPGMVPRMDMTRAPPPPPPNVGPQGGPPNMARPPRIGPTRMPGPGQFMPRPEGEPFPPDSRSGMDHSGPRPGMPGRGRGSFFRDGPPRGPHGRPISNFRSQRESEYDSYEDERYSEYNEEYEPGHSSSNPYGGPSYDGGVNNSNRPPFIQYNLDQQAHRKQERGPTPTPMMKNQNPPRMEAPTGIPPVRITGRY